MQLSQRLLDNFVQWDGKKKNFFETYYIKWNDAKRKQATWLRYTIFNSTSQTPECAVWATFIDDKNPKRNVAIKQTFPINQAKVVGNDFRLEIANSGITHTEAWGEVARANKKISWKIKVEKEGEMVRHFPAMVYKKMMPITKFVAPFCWHKISGQLKINNETIELNNLPAHQAHFWGKKQVYAWVWGNCSLFKEDPNFLFEGVCAKVKVGGLVLPMTCLHFYWEGNLYSFNSLTGSFLSNKSSNDLCQWDFQAQSDKLLFVGKMTSKPEDMILYRFQDPDGEYRYSHNNFHANLVIEIYKKENSVWKKIKTLNSERGSAFEVAEPQHDKRVKWILE